MQKTIDENDIGHQLPPPHARELQIIKLEGDDTEFDVPVRAPGNFAAAWMHVDQGSVMDPATGKAMVKVTPVVAFDTTSGGETISRHLVLVPFGRTYATRPGMRLDFLGAYLDPVTRFPVAIYEAVAALVS